MKHLASAATRMDAARLADGILPPMFLESLADTRSGDGSLTGSLTKNTSSSFMEIYDDLKTVQGLELFPAALHASGVAGAGAGAGGNPCVAPQLPSLSVPTYSEEHYGHWGMAGHHATAHHHQVPQLDLFPPTPAHLQTQAQWEQAFAASTPAHVVPSLHTALSSASTAPQPLRHHQSASQRDAEVPRSALGGLRPARLRRAPQHHSQFALTASTSSEEEDDDSMMMECDDSARPRHAHAHALDAEADPVFELRADKGADVAPVPHTIYKYDNQKFAEGPAWHTAMAIVLRVRMPAGAVPDDCEVYISRTMRETQKQDMAHRPLPVLARGDGFVEFQLKNSFFGFSYAGWVRRQLDQVSFRFNLVRAGGQVLVAQSPVFRVEKIKPSNRWE